MVRLSRLTVLRERLRASLFPIPATFVVLAILLAVAMLELDARVYDTAGELPNFVASTVDSARALLGTVATATITVAGIAFSVTLLVVQMASSQYSPRVVHGIFRDPVNKRVMGFVVGTFTYCLVVLQSVRGAVEDGGEAIVPNASVVLALFLGVSSVLSVIAFISHNAHSMEVSEILQEVTDQALEAIDARWPTPEDAPEEVSLPGPSGEALIVPFAENGWVESVDPEGLLAALGPAEVLELEIAVGRYAVAGVPLARIRPRPADEARAIERTRAAVALGRTRTLAQDPAYGLRQLVDVGLRALSSGVDDPTTAQDAIFHVAAVLRRIQERVPPARVVEGEEGRVVVMGEMPDHASLVRLAFDELRQSSASHPNVAIYLLEAIHLLCRAEHPPAPATAREAMLEEARLVVEGVMRADALVHDQEAVRAAYEDRFGEEGLLTGSVGGSRLDPAPRA